MKAIKATIVQGTFIENNEEHDMYAVQIHEDGSFVHSQRTDQISYSKYAKLIQNNHPEYALTQFSEAVDMTTPPTEFKTEEGSVEASTDYLDDATKDAFTVEDVVFQRPQLTPEHQQEVMEEIVASMPHVSELEPKDRPIMEKFIEELEEARVLRKQPIPYTVDEETGEVKEVNTNNSNTNTMNKEQEASAEAQPVKKVSIAAKAKYYSKVSMVVGVQAVTAPTHATLKITADSLRLVASGIDAVNRGVRNVEVAVVTAAKISKYNREELKQRVDNRSAKIERYAIAPVTIPVGIMLAIRQNLKNPVDQPQMQTA